ncbi:MAG TPA: ATP-binding protein [Rhizomicrobium sp.]|jgi:serine/threonine-protein kinase RsbW|nr:ATP-binding protein [Rhizomicrobium sp.]
MSAEQNLEDMSGLRLSEFVDGKLHLVLNNTMRAVSDGRREIQRHCALRSYDAKVINRLEIIFEELVSNTIRHGFTAHSNQSISVFAADRPGLIALTLEDDGVPFDPLTIPEPEPFTSIETARIGGLGISLVRKLSAGLRYERLTGSDTPQRGFRPCNRIEVLIAA